MCNFAVLATPFQEKSMIIQGWSSSLHINHSGECESEVMKSRHKLAAVASESLVRKCHWEKLTVEIRTTAQQPLNKKSLSICSQQFSNHEPLVYGSRLTLLLAFSSG